MSHSIFYLAFEEDFKVIEYPTREIDSKCFEVNYFVIIILLIL